MSVGARAERALDALHELLESGDRGRRRRERRGEPVHEAELRRLWDWFRPMVPYYVERALSPSVPLGDRVPYAEAAAGQMRMGHGQDLAG